MPQALTFSLTNILKFMSYLSPLLITFFMIMYSILTNNIVKGLIFMAGLVIITFINYLLKNSIKSPQSELASPFCNTLPAPFTFRSENNIFNSPSTSSTIIAFAASFLIYPMFLNNEANIPLTVFLIALTGINGSVEYSDLCTPLFGIFLGILIGVFFGIIYYSLVAMTNEEMAFFSKVGSNNVQCSKPKKQKFKCAVKYHNKDLDVPFIQNSNDQYLNKSSVERISDEIISNLRVQGVIQCPEGQELKNNGQCE